MIALLKLVGVAVLVLVALPLLLLWLDPLLPGDGPQDDGLLSPLPPTEDDRRRALARANHDA